MYTVTITKQGQISIPAKLRKKFGLQKTQKAIVSEEKNRIVIEPVPDILELEGILHHKAIKGKSIDEIIELEEKTVGEAVADRYRKKMNKMGIRVPK